MGINHGCVAAGFFLPIGNVEALESEVFFLMELWQTSYDGVMQIPYSRRKRLVEEKEQLERSRANKRKAAAKMPRGRRRR